MNAFEEIKQTVFNKEIKAGTPIKLIPRNKNDIWGDVYGMVVQNNGHTLVYTAYSKNLKKVKTYDLSLTDARFYYSVKVGKMVFDDE